MEDKIIIKSHKLRDEIINTKFFIVWNGSIEDNWNHIIRPLSNFVSDNPFFIGSTNEYNKDCGWYVKLIDLKPMLESIYEEITQQYDYEAIALMMNKYNRIIEYINSQIDEDYYIPSLKLCDNTYCLYCIDNRCCNLNQTTIEPNNLTCSESIRSDYKECIKDLRDKAERTIRYMDINQLLQVLKI